MANLLGELWNNREPNWTNVCSIANVKLHLYGKLSARPGRKMGHLTAIAASPHQAALEVERARKSLRIY
jgi:5-(carboxyamino)imidazole ribonucleotide synthase